MQTYLYFRVEAHFKRTKIDLHLESTLKSTPSKLNSFWLLALAASVKSYSYSGGPQTQNRSGENQKVPNQGDNDDQQRGLVDGLPQSLFHVLESLRRELEKDRQQSATDRHQIGTRHPRTKQIIK